jgi:hypothetical protein
MKHYEILKGWIIKYNKCALYQLRIERKICCKKYKFHAVKNTNFIKNA